MKNKRIEKLERQMAAYEKYIKSFTPNSVDDVSSLNSLISELNEMKLEYVCLCNHLAANNKQI